MWEAKLQIKRDFHFRGCERRDIWKTLESLELAIKGKAPMVVEPRVWELSLGGEGGNIFCWSTCCAWPCAEL